MGSEDLYARAVASLPGGNTRTTVFVPPRPPYAVRGEGYTLHDDDGHSAIDLQANMSALVHGHAHPAVTAAIADAAAEGTAFGLPTESELALAEHLRARMPALERVRFANSGTEAVMAALRLARAHAGKSAILRFEGCYHGAYDAVLDSPRGVPPGLLDDQVIVPWGDVDAFTAALQAHADRLACVLVDLMPNRAGLVPAAPEFALALRARTREHGVLLIVDEVITFRLELGGLHSAYGLDPDLVTLGKAIGGGLPVGAFGGRDEVMRLFDPREPGGLEHGGTFTAAPVVMRAGLASLERFDANEIARINRLGDALRERLRALGLKVNGRGSLLRILHDEPGELWWRLYRAGVLIGHNGLTCVCTAMDDAAVDEVVARVRTAL